MSTYNEFAVVLNDYKFDIIALTESWLRDSIPINKTMFKLLDTIQFLKTALARKEEVSDFI